MQIHHRSLLFGSLGLLALLLLATLSACVLPASSPPPTPDEDELFREAIQTLDVVYGPTFAAMTQVAVVPPTSQPPAATPIPPSPTSPPAPTATPVPTQPPQQVSQATQAPTATRTPVPTRKPVVDALPAEEGGFSIQSLNIGICGGVPAAIFGVRNLSGRTLESLSLTIEDLTEDETLFGPETSDAPFLGSDRDCPPGSDRLPSGRLGYVGAEVGRKLSGHTIWAEVILCTREDLDGTCYLANVEFVMP